MSRPDHAEFLLEDLPPEDPRTQALAEWLGQMEAQGCRVHLFIAEDLRIYVSLTIQPGDDPEAQQRLQALYDKASTRLVQIAELDSAQPVGDPH